MLGKHHKAVQEPNNKAKANAKLQERPAKDKEESSEEDEEAAPERELGTNEVPLDALRVSEEVEKRVMTESAERSALEQREKQERAKSAALEKRVRELEQAATETE